MRSEVGTETRSTGRPANLLFVLAGTAGITLVAYLGWLAWDQRKARIPGTSNFQVPTIPGR